MSSSAEEEAAREKYRVENQQTVQGQAVGDQATVHIYNAPVYHTPSAPHEASTPAETKRIWNVPYPRNALFTGRTDLLDQLASALRTGQSATLSQPPKEERAPKDMRSSHASKDIQPQAISGLGGIGKTQVALEYAYRYREKYQVVLWVLADSRESLTTSHLEVARLLNLPEKEGQESAHVIGAVKEWLRTSTNYLLVLDNADDLELAQEFLPPQCGGHVLLTTRAQAMGRFAKRLEVETLPLEQGVLFLLRRAGVLAADAPVEQANEGERKVAGEICTELGGLPLALDQAGAYIEETDCGLVKYAQRYQQQRTKLLAQRRGLVKDHPLPVATTWELSFEQVKQRNQAAAELLRLCAFLHPNSIPEEIILYGAAHLGPVLAPVVNDPFALDDAIALLRTYGLIDRDSQEKTLRVHRLVQAVLQDTMESQVRRQWVERAVLMVKEALQQIDFSTWEYCHNHPERSISQAQVSTIWIGPQGLHMTDEAAELLQFVSW